jgi:hypothetical protein
MPYIKLKYSYGFVERLNDDPSHKQLTQKVIKVKAYI